VYLAWATVWYLLTGFGHLCRGQVFVLCYHGVTACQQQRFARQMRRIAGRAVDASELTSVGDSPGLPRVCVTFDDGFACLLDTALPIMCELKIPALVFAVTGNLGDKPRWAMPLGHPEAEEPVMTADQVRAAAQAGFCRFGSHTVCHPNLTALSGERLRSELMDSKSALEALLSVTIEDLALPFGCCTDEVTRACFAAGYKRIYTLRPSLCEPGRGNGVIGRFSMSPDVWALEFILTCAGAYAWLDPWRRFIRRVRNLLSPLSRRSLAPA
jgi:peptidoglycan/xylan/chitin deacetylase (PgdA/CDA1 family)